MTRAELRAYFKDILNRSDCTDVQADRFIDLGIRKLERVLRTPAMERTNTYVSDGSGSITIPSTYLELIGIFIDERRLERVSGSDAYLYKDWTSPQFYWRDNNQFVIRGKPAIDAEIVLKYYGEFEPLGDDNYATLEFSIYPDAIVYSALIYACEFYLDERLPLMEARYNNVIMEIQGGAEKDEFTGRDLRLSSPYQGIDY